MSTGQISIYSKHPLVAEWLSYFLKNLGWVTILEEGDQVSTESIIAVVEINNEEDLLLLKKKIPVIVFSRLPEAKLIGLLFDFEVKGIICMSSNLATIRETVDAAASGNEYFDEVFITYLLSNKYRKIHERISSLSKREHEIVKGILYDLTNDEIATKYNLSVRTVNAHKRNILQKMNERSLVGVIRTMLTYSLGYY